MPGAQSGHRIAAVQGRLFPDLRCDPETRGRSRGGPQNVRPRGREIMRGHGQGRSPQMPAGDPARGRLEMLPGHQRSGVPQMKRGLRRVDVWMGAALMLSASMAPACAQTALTTETMVNQLSGLETAPDID